MGAYIGEIVRLVSADEESADQAGVVLGVDGDGRCRVLNLETSVVHAPVRYGDSRDQVIDDAEADRADVNKNRREKITDLGLFAHAPACYPAGPDAEDQDDDDQGDDGEDPAAPVEAPAVKPAPAKKAVPAKKTAGKAGRR